jgi:uncharacterized membrane protein
MGSRAPAVRRLAAGAAIWLIVGVVVAPFVIWPLAILVGWNASAAAFLLSVLPVIIRADGPRTKRIAMREDETRDTAWLILQLSCAASLIAVAVALGVAKHESGGRRVLLVTMAVLTVLLSWTVVNCVFTLRYADLYYSAASPAIDFGDGATYGQPDYRDFAYLAFTIGMTYQVSDTALRDRGLRRTVLQHAFLSYFFGVVIVAAGVNVIAGLLG